MIGGNINLINLPGAVIIQALIKLAWLLAMPVKLTQALDLLANGYPIHPTVMLPMVHKSQDTSQVIIRIAALLLKPNQVLDLLAIGNPIRPSVMLHMEHNFQDSSQVIILIATLLLKRDQALDLLAIGNPIHPTVMLHMVHKSQDSSQVIIQNEALPIQAAITLLVILLAAKSIQAEAIELASPIKGGITTTILPIMNIM